MFLPTGLEEAGCHESYSCKKVTFDNNHRSLTVDLELCQIKLSPGSTMITTLGDPEQRTHHGHARLHTHGDCENNKKVLFQVDKLVVMCYIAPTNECSGRKRTQSCKIKQFHKNFQSEQVV